MGGLSKFSVIAEDMSVSANYKEMRNPIMKRKTFVD